MPNKKQVRYIKDYDLPEFEAGLLAENVTKARFFEDCLAIDNCKPKNILNWVLGDVTRILNERNCDITATKLTAKNLTDMIVLIENGTISNTAAKTVLDVIIDEDASCDNIVKEKGLAQNSNTDELEALANEIINANPKTIDDYKNGKTNVLGFLVGQCMRASKGQGNPAILRDILLKIIETR